jgi:hypothetical protein
MRTNFNNVLVVYKTSRLQRFEKLGLMLNPFIEKAYKHNL